MLNFLDLSSSKVSREPLKVHRELLVATKQSNAGNFRTTSSQSAAELMTEEQRLCQEESDGEMEG